MESQASGCGFAGLLETAGAESFKVGTSEKSTVVFAQVGHNFKSLYTRVYYTKLESLGIVLEKKNSEQLRKINQLKVLEDL